MAIELAGIREKLRHHYGRPPRPLSLDPFAMVLAVNVAYLADDDQRQAAMALLAKTVGLTPAKIAGATLPKLERVTKAGILAPTFAAKLRRCGQLAMESFGGDLATVVKMPAPAAIKALRKFPGIGLPGAEQILLFAASRPFLAPDSNGLRVLVRLGMVPNRRSYQATYEAARPIERSLAASPAALRELHGLLRVHGKTTCRRTRPQCGGCPLRAICPSADRVSS